MSLQKPVTKEILTDDAKIEFQQAGYALSDATIESSAFDFIAKKNHHLTSKKIVTKVFVDLDMFKKQASIELQLISKLISGFPLVVAHAAAGKSMEDATLYRRHDVSAVSLPTLHKFLQYEKGIQVAKISQYAHRGGIYVNISKKRLKQKRKQLKLSLTILSQQIGLSRLSLYRYEKGQTSPKLSNYSTLVNALGGDDLDVPLDILETEYKALQKNPLKAFTQPHSQLQKEIDTYLKDKNFHVYWFKKSEPFDGFSAPTIDLTATKESLDADYPIITGVESDDRNDTVRITLLNKLSHFLRKKTIWFIEDDSPESISQSRKSRHFIVVKVSDLEQMADEDFTNLVKKG
ncbi:MAG: helix-turn-helix domain-containing protein [Candidatus Heimdallarchaeota archaeon]